ncbi:unnamed protein product [Symbiodinium microadriaticum]|nr:unnamed protein product [Symbiodinium sp. KB8]CAE7424954.1 unnamed protein product [Symbiodinium microadriaticum]
MFKSPLHLVATITLATTTLQVLADALQAQAQAVLKQLVVQAQAVLKQLVAPVLEALVAQTALEVLEALVDVLEALEALAAVGPLGAVGGATAKHRGEGQKAVAAEVALAPTEDLSSKVAHGVLLLLVDGLQEESQAVVEGKLASPAVAVAAAEEASPAVVVLAVEAFSTAHVRPVLEHQHHLPSHLHHWPSHAPVLHLPPSHAPVLHLPSSGVDGQVVVAAEDAAWEVAGFCWPAACLFGSLALVRHVWLRPWLATTRLGPTCFRHCSCLLL